MNKNQIQDSSEGVSAVDNFKGDWKCAFRCGLTGKSCRSIPLKGESM